MVIEGIIRPPPEIRIVADRTAMFVAKNGRAFEQRILGSAKGKTPKFAFLQPTSPFHAYYEDRIKHFENGGAEAKKEEDNNEEKNKKADTKVAAVPKPPAKDTVAKQKASIIDPVAKALLEQRSVITNHFKKEKEKRRKASESSAGEKTPNEEEKNDNPDPDSDELPLPPPPEPLDSIQVVAPHNLTPTQIETIQLIAQFVAIDGKGGPFLPALINREWSNPEFGFCQPRHIHFSYFSALVDVYRKIIEEYVEAADDLEGETKKMEKEQTVESTLNDVAYRVEYERELERRRQKHQENSAMEDGEIANTIDWHDFVVVETIDFPIEEQVDVGLSMLPTKKATTTAIATPTTMAATTKTSGATATAAGNDMDMEESSDEEDDEADNIRVVPSYTPKVVGTYDPSTARAIDPMTGKSVAVADMPEHMRIQLLDPKWAEERKKFQDKQKDSNLVGGDAVVANIARMSQKTTIPNAGASGASTNTPGSIGVSKLHSSTTGTPIVTTAPVVGPTVGKADSGGVGQQQHNNPFNGGHGTDMEQPPLKRARTALELPPPLQQQPHKVTRAPPLVAHPQAPSSNNNMDTVMKNDPDNSNNNDSTTAATDAPPETKPPPEKKLLPADEFIASLGENPVVELQIRVPNDATCQNWNFFGQTVTLSDVNPSSSIRDIKEILSKQHLNSMPVNKIQLKTVVAPSPGTPDAKGKFLNKNNATLATLNIGPTTVLELKSKTRGGR